MNNLVIVESPTKARTLAKFLGRDFVIEASVGHIRDLPKSDLGIDIEDNFSPQYIVPRDKRKKVNELKKLASDAKTIWLATDPDREGEAIAWHIKELISGSSGVGVLGKKGAERSTPVSLRRVTFHEITEEAIKEAFENPREIDFQLVDAQQARRILDRLVGYKLSPLLWRKIKRGLSAGRVQSVALRLIVEREKEIEAFKPQEYWSIEAALETNQKEKFTASLFEKNSEKLEIGNSKESEELVADLQKAEYKVSKIIKKEVKRSPAPPFSTSTLQQSAGNKLGMSAKKTMTVAQALYERGLITYMRTDSLNLSPQAVGAAKKYIEEHFGENYSSGGRQFKTKSKVAQEAHEAIRPTNLFVTAEKIKDIEGLTRDHTRLYDLIWKRMIASQMAEAVLDQTSVIVSAKCHDKSDIYGLRASGSVVKFEGWLKLFGVESEVENSENVKENSQEGGLSKNQLLPELVEGAILDLLELQPEQHFTQPPPRYNEASLIKKLEELGIGRPSTYAPILSTIQERFYVEKKERRFVPTSLGMSVTDFLLKYFPQVFDYDFTARMEGELDDVANGERSWQPVIKEFYEPFEKTLEKTEEQAERVQLEPETVDKECPECGKPLQIRYGKFGKFLACTGFPECKYTENLVEKINARCPQDNGEVVMRKTRTGKPFYGCKNWPECKWASWTKPKGEKIEDRVQSTEHR